MALRLALTCIFAFHGAAAFASRPSAGEVLQRVRQLGGVWQGDRAEDVTGVALVGCQEVSTKLLSQLASLETLESLNLSFSNVAEEHLALLPAFPQLRALSLVGTAVTDDGAAELAQLRTLTSLDLTQTRIGDRAVQALARREGLVRLAVGDTAISGEGVRAVAEIGSLKEVDLRGTDIGDGDLGPLAKLELEELYLNRTAVTDAGIQAITRISTLRVLDLSGTRITDDAIQDLIAMERLEILAVRNTSLTKRGVIRLVMARDHDPQSYLRRLVTQ